MQQGAEFLRTKPESDGLEVYQEETVKRKEEVACGVTYVYLLLGRLS